MGKRIEFDDEARESLRMGVDQLCRAVRVTLGPRGRNVVIDSTDGAPTITNDGLTIAREIELADPFENMGAQLVREAAVQTGEVAGDGTTTATVLAHTIVLRGLQAVAAGHNPMAVKRGMDRAVAEVVSYLESRARDVSAHEDVARVATVSAGGDAEVGKLVADALQRVGEHGVVTIEEGRGIETTLEVVEGMRFERGYLSPYFVTDPETMRSELDDALVLITTERLSRAEELLAPLEAAARAGRPLLVIAEDIEGEALATLVVNRLRGTVGSLAVRAPESGDRRGQMLDDLSVLTGAAIYSPNLGRSLDAFDAADLGRVKRVVADREVTTLVEGGGDATSARERINELQEQIRECDSTYDRQWFNERLARLTGGVAVLRVGAPTEIEQQLRKGRVEDAVSAARAAVEEGVVPGGGVAYLRTIEMVRNLDLVEDAAVGRDIILEALHAPAAQIAENAGLEGRVVVEKILEGDDAYGFDAVTEEYRDMEEAAIVDPTKVVRCALQHAASIGSMVLTTDAIVVDAPDDEEEGAA